jgi:drug/metabolite transporter (DMT)-like permease
LKESVSIARWVCTLFGFIGVITITYQDFNTFNFWIWLPIISAFSFAVITLIAKRISSDEHIYTSLFYFGLGTSLVFLIPAIAVWRPLTLFNIAILTILGINGNLMQVCMFKAFDIVDVSGFMPLRYIEMVFTFMFGYLFFRQIPSYTTVIGGIIITISAIIITALEQRKNK